MIKQTQYLGRLCHQAILGAEEDVDDTTALVRRTNSHVQVAVVVQVTKGGHGGPKAALPRGSCMHRTQCYTDAWKCSLDTLLCALNFVLSDLAQQSIMEHEQKFYLYLVFKIIAKNNQDTVQIIFMHKLIEYLFMSASCNKNVK